MKTGFTFSLDDLKRLSVNQSGSNATAEQASNEMVSFANKLFEGITDYSNLNKAMTKSAEIEIIDALIAIKHISTELSALRNQYLSSDLIDYFDPANQKVFKILEKATMASKPLLDLLK